jgi:hypothetical protein
MLIQERQDLCSSALSQRGSPPALGAGVGPAIVDAADAGVPVVTVTTGTIVESRTIFHLTVRPGGRSHTCRSMSHRRTPPRIPAVFGTIVAFSGSDAGSRCLELPPPR